MGAAPVRELTSATAVQETLTALSQCMATLLEASERDAIYFDDDLIPASLKLSSQILNRAATLKEAERISYLRLVIQHGPSMCAELVTQAERRNPPVLKGSDLPRSCLGIECGGN